jgi:hypothetical protein
MVYDVSTAVWIGLPGKVLSKAVEGVEAVESVWAELHLVTMADCLTSCSQDGCLACRLARVFACYTPVLPPYHVR